MFGSIKVRARRAVRKAGFLSGGLLLIVVGVGFLTSALWIAIASAQGAMLASLIVGMAYTGIGAILVGVASSHPEEVDRRASAKPPPPPAAPNDSAALVNAFLSGLYAGTKAKRST